MLPEGRRAYARDQLANRAQEKPTFEIDAVGLRRHNFEATDGRLTQAAPNECILIAHVVTKCPPRDPLVACMAKSSTPYFVDCGVIIQLGRQEALQSLKNLSQNLGLKL